eukprot:TRINITY_DN15182_c0_g1_i1.p1 TRINITY_DN15182_c0_g1~~TRINITY_DN15182_c0_g1_i1.p1  ORF type:complete len:585 (+),score=132.81 TRINITY_DN15182_c0_g1_i1:64-1755(+)
MAELKGLYASRRTELGLQPVVTQNLGRSSNNQPNDKPTTPVQPTTPDANQTINPLKHEPGVDNKSVRRNGTNITPDATPTTSTTTIVDPISQLSGIIRSIISNHGGSCAYETILEHVKMRWQREKVTRADGQLWGHQDCKKAINSVLKNNKLTATKPALLKDKENEGSWTVEGEDPKKSIPVLIWNCLEEYAVPVYIELIYKVVRKNCRVLSKEDLELYIRICLTTDPRFQEDPDSPDYYLLPSLKKKRRSAKEEEGWTDRRVKRKTRSEDEDFSARPKRGDKSGASPDYTATDCKGCGASEPGKAKGSVATWRRGANGELLCFNCSLQQNKQQACPVCGKMYRREDADDEANPWIRCDDCHRWVMIKCDNIEDLSLYDDGNPNHLHYSCPICRGENPLQQTTQPPAKNGRGRKPKPKKEEPISVPPPHHDEKETSPEPAESEEEDQGGLEMLEKDLLYKLEDDTVHIDDPDLKTKLEAFQEEFANEITTLSVRLIGKRDRERHKNQADFDRQIKRLREEKMRAEETLEYDLMCELKAYYVQQRKEFQQKINAITSTKLKEKA